MSERATLAAVTRDVTGKKAKQLRRQGVIPAVIYGQGENLNIQVENLSLMRVLRDVGTTNLIDISIGDENHTVLAKEVQVHVTRGDLIHVDFYEVNMQEKLIVEAALVPVGIAAPVEEGLGTTALVTVILEIECLPSNLISEIEVDLTRIETPDDVVLVSDLEVPEGVEILAEPDQVVARFDYIQIVEEEEEEEEEGLMMAEAADEVEVIGKGKQADEEEEFEE
ncbi:MAG: 50S ribosomal protein L25 [Chloroflexota bacterium]|jgi:large subunit ribosomal protein L25